MKPFGRQIKKLSFLTCAAYFFIFAVCAKGVFFYAAQHPSKDQLTTVYGIIGKVYLGGQGKSTYLEIESETGTHRYSTYYGKVWPKMRLLQPGDRVELLAERNRLNRDEFITGKRYYIWQLIHRRQIIINYRDVLEMVRSEEAAANRFINIWIAAGLIILLFAWVRKIFLIPAR